MKAIARFTAALTALASGSAIAHPGHETASSGVIDGLLHPLLGADHLVAMLLVGVWAAQLGGRARLWVPLSFVTLMAVGAALALNGIALPNVEPGIVISLLALGLVTALAWRPLLGVAAATTGMFALFHGAAHGLELPQTASPLAYAAGFVVATAMLHITGLALAAAAQARLPMLARAAGALGVVTGLAFAVS